MEDREKKEKHNAHNVTAAMALRDYADRIENEDRPSQLIDFSQHLEFNEIRDGKRGDETHITFTLFEPYPKGYQTSRQTRSE